MSYSNVEVMSMPLSRRLLIAGAIAGFGWFFSFPFHLLGIGGIFTPLWIPAGVAACLVPPLIAVLMAILLPLCSTIFTGMPPFTPPVFWLVTGELVIYSYTISLCYHHYKMKNYWSVLLGSIADKLILMLFILLIDSLDRIQPWLNWHSLTKGIPGIILAIILVPLIVHWLEKHHPSGLAPA
ncbi:MAG: hypothetical protein ACE14V_07995 [bacterium]